MRQRFGTPAPGEIAGAVPRDGRDPGGKLFGIAHAPARFPRLDQRILDDVLGFLAVLQNPVGNGEKISAGESG